VALHCVSATALGSAWSVALGGGGSPPAGGGGGACAAISWVQSDESQKQAINGTPDVTDAANIELLRR
jgi:hypothetical protein